MSCGLHDVLAFEALGKPAVLVASSVFEKAATDQSTRLGAPALRRAFVPHPIQDRTDEEITALGTAAAPQLLSALRV